MYCIISRINHLHSPAAMVRWRPFVRRVTEIPGVSFARGAASRVSPFFSADTRGHTPRVGEEESGIAALSSRGRNAKGSTSEAAFSRATRAKRDCEATVSAFNVPLSPSLSFYPIDLAFSFQRTSSSYLQLLSLSFSLWLPPCCASVSPLATESEGRRRKPLLAGVADSLCPFPFAPDATPQTVVSPINGQMDDDFFRLGMTRVVSPTLRCARPYLDYFFNFAPCCE